MPNSFLTFFHAVAHYSSPDVLLRVMKCLENWRRGTCLPPPTGSSLLNYNNSIIKFNNKFDPLRDDSISAAHREPGEDDSVSESTGEGENIKLNQSLRTDVQLLFICALVGPLVHRFEKVQIGGTSGQFLVVLVELTAMVTDQMEAASRPGLCTLEHIVDFM
jgi:hypothetical protein